MEKKLGHTKKERKQIYLKLLKQYEKGSNSSLHLCLNLRRITSKISYIYNTTNLGATEIVKEYFPEIWECRPKTNISGSWWGMFDTEPRKNCLALAIAMCE
tara:strand:+ start:2451 stop:2753 length:303 start_codon:yes stop_codon:yes gene_type:complete